MFTEIVVAVLVGNLLGTFTGIMPGIHINLVSVLIFNFLSFFLAFAEPLTIAVAILSMAITHTFVDGVPSIYLGAPDESNVLCVLPGHRMLLRGEGHNACLLMVAGSLGSLVLSLSLFPFFIFLLQIFYPMIKPYIGYLLLFIAIFLIIKEKHSKLWASIVFLLSGILGILVLNNPKLDDPLFPMLSGLFGVSTLLLSIFQKIKIPEQKATAIEIPEKGAYKTIVSSVAAGTLASFLPGLGTSQIATLGSQLVKGMGDAGFLILVGGINTVNMVASLVTWYVIQKERNGAIAVMAQIMGDLTTFHLLIFIAVVLLSTFFATWCSITLSKKFCSFVQKVHYGKLCWGIISFIALLVLVISHGVGFLVFIIATAIGVVPVLKGVGKNYLMGCLLIPVILYFLL